MIRFTHLFFLLLLPIAAPLLAQSKAPPAPQSDQVAQIKAQDAKIEALTTAADEARYEKNIAEIKAEILQSQTSWFEILISAMIGLFGILITVIIIYFAFRFGKSAVSEAKAAAVDALKTERGSIQSLLDEAKAAVADIHVERETARELTKGMSPGEAPSDPERQEKIADLAKEAMKKARKERSVDDYRALVLDARIQKDWAAMERRASAMIYLFEGEADEESIAFALYSKGFALGAIHKTLEAIAVYDEVVARYRDTGSTLMQESVAKALFNKGNDLGRLDRFEDAIAAFDEVSQQYSDSPNLALQEIAASALVNKGFALSRLERVEEAIAINDAVVARYGDADGHEMQKQVAMALRNKGVELSALDRFEDAIAAYDAILRRFGDKDSPALQEQVAKALFNKACALASVGKTDACIDALTSWGVRRGGVDCEIIKADSDFDKIRDRKAFKAFLAAHGCV